MSNAALAWGGVAVLVALLVGGRLSARAARTAAASGRSFQADRSHPWPQEQLVDASDCACEGCVEERECQVAAAEAAAAPEADGVAPSVLAVMGAEAEGFEPVVLGRVAVAPPPPAMPVPETPEVSEATKRDVPRKRKPKSNDATSKKAPGRPAVKKKKVAKKR